MPYGMYEYLTVLVSLSGINLYCRQSKYDSRLLHTMAEGANNNRRSRMTLGYMFQWHIGFAIGCRSGVFLNVPIGYYTMFG